MSKILVIAATAIMCMLIVVTNLNQQSRYRNVSEFLGNFAIIEDTKTDRLYLVGPKSGLEQMVGAYELEFQLFKTPMSE